MTLIEIKEAYYSQYPILKYHNCHFWESEGNYYCQAFNEITKEFYGNTFKLDINNLTMQKVIIGNK